MYKMNTDAGLLCFPLSITDITNIMSNTNATSTNAPASAKPTRYFFAHVSVSDWINFVRETTRPGQSQYEVRVVANVPRAPHPSMISATLFDVGQYYPPGLQSPDVGGYEGSRDGDIIFIVRFTPHGDDEQSWPYIGPRDELRVVWDTPSASDGPLLRATVYETDGPMGDLADNNSSDESVSDGSVPDSPSSSGEYSNPPSPYHSIVAPEAPAIRELDFGPGLGDLATFRLQVEAGIDLEAAEAPQPRVRVRTQDPRPSALRGTATQFREWLEFAEQQNLLSSLEDHGRRPPRRDAVRPHDEARETPRSRAHPVEEYVLDYRPVERPRSARVPDTNGRVDIAVRVADAHARARNRPVAEAPRPVIAPQGARRGLGLRERHNDEEAIEALNRHARVTNSRHHHVEEAPRPLQNTNGPRLNKPLPRIPQPSPPGHTRSGFREPAIDVRVPRRDTRRRPAREAPRPLMAPPAARRVPDDMPRGSYFDEEVAEALYSWEMEWNNPHQSHSPEVSPLTTPRGHYPPDNGWVPSPESDGDWAPSPELQDNWSSSQELRADRPRADTPRPRAPTPRPRAPRPQISHARTVLDTRRFRIPRVRAATGTAGRPSTDPRAGRAHTDLDPPLTPLERLQTGGAGRHYDAVPSSEEPTRPDVRLRDRFGGLFRRKGPKGGK